MGINCPGLQDEVDEECEILAAELLEEYFFGVAWHAFNRSC